MKKIELIERVIEHATGGEGLKIKETCKYKKDLLRNEELYLLLNNDYVEYEIIHDCNFDYIIITRKYGTTKRGGARAWGAD